MVVGEARLPTGPVISREAAICKLVEKYADPSEIPDQVWRKILSDEEYYVCRMGGTEPSFSGILTKYAEPGRYNCRCCGTDLFLSDSKFYNGCGWPAFTGSYDEDRNIIRLADKRFGLNRTEVRCKKCHAHLGTCLRRRRNRNG
ncbi:Methionine-R-sulfoxide reductase B2, mitochondrial [Aphelenchoides bicaudatus]|nr:Methionine-R-sulfoxide reductase B2, mitochondrial [Aphelenchoides bicaudatus]